jgi:hypothetical protein
MESLNGPATSVEITITVGAGLPVVYLFGTPRGTSDYMPKALIPHRRAICDGNAN